MRNILTASKIESLYRNPIEGKYLDGENLYLFVSKAGSLSFRYRVRTPEITSWFTIGTYPNVSLAEARDKSLELAKIISNGISPKVYYERQKSLNIGFNTLAQEYIKFRLPLVRVKDNSKKQELRIIENELIAKLNNIKLNELTSEIIHKKLIQPKIHDAPASVKRTLITLKQLLRYAIELNYINANPIDRINVSTLHKDRPRTRFLTFEELGKLLSTVYKANLRTQWKVAVHLLILLLCRKNELLQARWEQVNFAEATFSLEENKMNKPTKIPLSTNALKLFTLLHRLNGDSEFVFTGNNIKKAPCHSTLNNILKFTETLLDQPFTIHDLRRTGASLLPKMGFDFIVIEAALNHEFRSGASRHYFHHDYFDERKAMLQSWADKIDTLLDDNIRLQLAEIGLENDKI